MAIDTGLAGRTWDAGIRSWTSTDALIYALGVGAGPADLAFTTENSAGVGQRVLPTFPVVLAGTRATPRFGDYELSQLLHAEQSVTLSGPLPVAGSARISGRVVAVYDKGRHAHIVTESALTDAATGRDLAVTRATVFVRDEGGFGGERGVAAPWERPDRPADDEISYPVPLNQALVYRLSGDRNPLHSDPAAASAAGFPRPILHGLCTFGYAGRALLAAACGGDAGRFGSMSARFSAPVLPGQELTVRIWRVRDGALFQVSAAGTVVLDRGVLTLPAATREPAGSGFAGSRSAS